MDKDIQDHLTAVLKSAAKKLKAGMDEGPGGPDVVLTTEEAALVYRLMTEGAGMRL